MLAEAAGRTLGRSTWLGGDGCGGAENYLQSRNLNLSPGFQLLDTLECLSNQGVA